MFTRMAFFITIPFVLFSSSSLAFHHETSSPIQPMKLLVRVMPLGEALKERDIGLPTKEVEAARRQLEQIVAGKDEKGNDNRPVPLTGFASLVSRNLDTIGADPTYRAGAKECAAALAEKKRWHEEHGGVPLSFGKITHFDVFESDPVRQLWEGEIETCSWVGNAEYYFKMKFTAAHTGQLRAVAKRSNFFNPFPATLNIRALEFGERMRLLVAMNQWDWKLHATGSSIEFLEAKRNGVDLDRSTDPLFTEPQNNCFDMFFKGGYPESRRLPASQFAYCMGRCDARILNTP